MFQHTKHLTQANKPNKKNRTKSGGRVEVTDLILVTLHSDEIPKKSYVLWKQHYRYE